MTTLLLLLALVALVLINVPIAVALGVIAAFAMVAESGIDVLLTAAVTMYDGAKSFPLIAIPLFILAGAIMNTSGISRRLIAFASSLLGFIRGGLAMVDVGTSIFFEERSSGAQPRGKPRAFQLGFRHPRPAFQLSFWFCPPTTEWRGLQECTGGELGCGPPGAVLD